MSSYIKNSTLPHQFELKPFQYYTAFFITKMAKINPSSVAKYLYEAVCYKYGEASNTYGNEIDLANHLLGE